MIEYHIENYVRPWEPYKESLSDKLRIGHLVLDRWAKKIVLVDINILLEVLENERTNSGSKKSKYYPIAITREWLEDVFMFESKYNAPHSMTIYTSLRNGFQVHEYRGNFYVAIRITEKISDYGTLKTKPKILFINELMDYLFLLKRDTYGFIEEDLLKINSAMNIDWESYLQ
ncbi:hypothetical protein ACFSQJ_15915 [Croceitalea marina]|uniref:PIN domain-containing protein n=1 Tax=Croceitalea marina TaxID=1775166 RepID=A0ABW5N1H5_9FLAO